MEAMPPKQLTLTAFRREIPDRVPVEIGLGPWWGARFFGYTCWDVYLHGNPSQVDMELSRNTSGHAITRRAPFSKGSQ